MSTISHKLQEELLTLQDKLYFAETNRLAGAKTYSISEVSKRLQEVLAKTPSRLCDEHNKYALRTYRSLR